MPKIIVAEGNAVLASVVRFHLERAKHDVVVSCSAQAMLNSLQRSEFDLMILDHQLPGQYGRDLVKLVRQQGRVNSRIPIVLLTTKRMQYDATDLHSSHAIARVLNKSVLPAEIVSVADEILLVSARR